MQPEAHLRSLDGREKPALFERVSTSEGTSSSYVLWGFFTVASALTAVAVCFTPGAERRYLAAIGNSGPAISQVSSAQARLDAVKPPADAAKDKELLSRLGALEEQLGTMTTGSIEPPAPPPLPAALPGVTPTAPLPSSSPAPMPSANAVRTTAIATDNEESLPTHTTFGVDLGAEASFGALRTRWENLRRQYPELASLSPRISVRDNKGKVELRLVAGPFDNAADAAKACAAILAKGTLCDGGLFDGQRLPAS